MRPMPETKQPAHVVKVTHTDPPTADGTPPMLYVVQAETVDEAVEAVRRIVADGVAVEPVGDVVLPGTATALGLLPGQARLL